jgi:hypothetical protein
MPESRLDNIFSSIVSNRDTFFEYVRFLLAEEVAKDDLLDGPRRKPVPPRGGDKDLRHAEFPMFERLIVAASRDPSKLKAVDNCIERLRATSSGDSAFVPPEFLDFWEIFRRLIPSKIGRGGNDVH